MEYPDPIKLILSAIDSLPSQEASAPSEGSMWDNLQGNIADALLATHLFMSRAIGRKRKSEYLRSVLLLTTNICSELERGQGILLRKDVHRQPRLSAVIQPLLIGFQKSLENAFTPYLPMELLLSDARTADFFRVTSFENTRTTANIENHKATINPDLVTLLMEYLVNANGENKRMSYHDLFYKVEFCKGLNGILVNATSTLQEDIYEFIFSKNFNTVYFYKHYVTQLKVQLEEIGAYQEQRAFLLQVQKTIRQIPRDDQTYLFSGLPEIKDIVCGYIEEEIKYIKKVQLLYQESYTVPTKNKSAGSFYFHVVFTVSQLNLFFKLMYDAGIVVTKRKAAMLEFICNHIGTVRKDNLSSRSFLNKSKNQSDIEIAKVKEKLHKMLSLLNALNS